MVGEVRGARVRDASYARSNRARVAWVRGARVSDAQWCAEQRVRVARVRGAMSHNRTWSLAGRGALGHGSASGAKYGSRI